MVGVRTNDIDVLEYFNGSDSGRWKIFNKFYKVKETVRCFLNLIKTTVGVFYKNPKTILNDGYRCIVEPLFTVEGEVFVPYRETNEFRKNKESSHNIS